MVCISPNMGKSYRALILWGGDNTFAIVMELQDGKAPSAMPDKVIL